MKRIIIAALVIASTFACKKNTDAKTGTPVKYYLKIEAAHFDNTAAQETQYKTITVN